MNKRQLAIKEAAILWARLVETGSESKYHTIYDLYEEGLLRQQSYKNGCPLCEQFVDDYICQSCPWPISMDNWTPRCRQTKSPYFDWWDAVTETQCPDPEKLKPLAKAVYDLIRTFK